ncbi:MAG: HEAT repeat domain-containing protein [Myxococcota bacterium]
MKLVEASRLVLRGESDERAYEIDLCEVGPDRFVVNFRYGPQGSVLREGSRTPVPVSETEARRVYERLVASRQAKGYVDADAVGPEAVPETEPSPPPSSRDEVLRRYLDDPSDAWTDLDGIVVRIGELRVGGCTERLVDLLVGASPRRAYNVVRALLRCGDESAVPALRSVLESAHPAHVRNLAAHAIVALATPEARARFVAEQTELVPPRFLDALAQPAIDTERLAADLSDQPRVLERLYLVHQPAHRAGLVTLLRGLSVHPPLWQAIRGVYRAAEARNDGEVFGILVSAISRSWHAYPAGLWPATRAHFVRRSWRTLFRLGTAGAFGDYVALATGVLLAVDDSDVQPPDRRGSTSHDLPFRRLWAFNNILYRASPDHASNRRALTFWRKPGAPSDSMPAERAEAWPEAWNTHPEQLVELLARSGCAPVHVFAARALRELPAA